MFKKILSFCCVVAVATVVSGCTREQFRTGLVTVGATVAGLLYPKVEGQAGDILDDIYAKCSQVMAIAASVDVLVASFQPSCKIANPIAKARAGIASVCAQPALVSSNNLSRIHIAVTDAYSKVKVAEAAGC